MFDPVVAFNNQSSSDVNYWFWSFGDGDSLVNNTKNPRHTYPGDTASFVATLIVHNAGFCYDTIKHLILIGPEYSFYIPNAFTPDGDGVNDEFFGKGVGIVEYQLTIFDRWGNFIFEADELNKGWDGKASGGAETAQQDVYVWKVALTDIFHKKHNYTGTVTIVRGR
jgi:gliding motility-associated-like protein